MWHSVERLEAIILNYIYKWDVVPGYELELWVETGRPEKFMDVLNRCILSQYFVADDIPDLYFLIDKSCY